MRLALIAETLTPTFGIAFDELWSNRGSSVKPLLTTPEPSGHCDWIHVAMRRDRGVELDEESQGCVAVRS
jgi:hypothetical protein